mgnify:CR=1 FL=1
MQACLPFYRWVQHPFNTLIFLMLVAIVVSGAIIFMMLCPSPSDGVMGWGGLRFDSNGQASVWSCSTITNSTALSISCAMSTGGIEWDAWMETNSQLMNGLFTLGAILNVPSRLGEAYVLCVAKNDKEREAFRCIFPRNYGINASTLWKRWTVVLLLLINCIGQIPICCAHWFYLKPMRPQWVVPVFLPICFGSASLAAFLDNKYSKESQRVATRDFARVVEA